MPRSKQPSASAACFDRIDALLSSFGRHWLRTTPVLKQSARYLMRGAAVLTRFLASVAPPELSLDRNLGRI